MIIMSNTISTLILGTIVVAVITEVVRRARLSTKSPHLPSWTKANYQPLSILNSISLQFFETGHMISCCLYYLGGGVIHLSHAL